MAENVTQLKQVAPDYHLRQRVAVKSTSGLRVQKTARVIFDFSQLDSAGAANSAIGAHPMNVFLPAKAVIVRSWYQVQSAFTSATNAGTIAMKCEAANDIKSALAVSDSTFGTTGFKEGVSDGTAANFKQASVERELTVTVAVEALTAGRLILMVEYHVGE